MDFLITGGASGVGAALVNRLNDHNVWIVDRSKPTEIASKHQFIAADLSSEDGVEQVLASLPENIDGIANVAGIAQAPEPETVLAVNFLALRTLSESLIARLSDWGRIVNVSSTAGRDWQGKYDRLKPLLATASFQAGLTWCQENRDLLARDPYTFSKRMVTAYTLRAAERAINGGFTVNSVSPGPIETPLYPQFESLMGKEHSDWTKAQTGRSATPDDIAQVIEMLLTAECGWLNGVDIPVDGGYTAGMESGWIDFSESPIMQKIRERKS